MRFCGPFFWNCVVSIVTDLDQLMFTDESVKDDCIHCHTHGYTPAGVPCVECIAQPTHQCHTSSNSGCHCCVWALWWHCNIRMIYMVPLWTSGMVTYRNQNKFLNAVLLQMLPTTHIQDHEVSLFLTIAIFITLRRFGNLLKMTQVWWHL